MSFSDSATPGVAKAQPSAQDTQKLIALLNNMMPLLQRIQSQALEQPSQFASPNLFSQGLSSPGLFPGLFLENQNPVLDQQAAANLVEDMMADSLCTLSAYLDNYAEQYPALNNCIGLVTQAADSFAMRDYAQTFGLIWQAYRLITMLRASHPQLPPPHAIAQSAQRPTTPLH
jgi:hypothetical protein